MIEAGDFYEFDNANTSQVPGYGSTYLSFDDLTPSPVLVDWDLITEPQVGFNGRQIHYTAGKTLGGSSALNDMIFHRTTKGGYDQWVDKVGDDSYEWDAFLPYLEKSVNFTAPNLAKIGAKAAIPYDPSVYSSAGAPLHVSYPNYFQPFDPFIQKAFLANGVPSIEGLASGFLDGFAASTFVFDPTTQTRSSSESSFLQSALASTNLVVYVRTQAQKVLFDAAKRATGVQVEANGALFTLSARKEVIVSAGVFHSPQILMLSGIGLKSALEKFQIPVISDLAGVGQNMWDHVFIFTSHETNLSTNSAVLTDPSLHAQAVDEYLNHQTGPLTGVGGEHVGWSRNSTGLSSSTTDQLAANFASDWPYFEYLALATGANPPNEPNANNYVFLTAAIQTILSRGTVTLQSANPVDAPIINPNALTTPAEAEVAVAAIRHLRSFATASGVQLSEYTPGSNYTTDAEILGWVRDHAVNGYHAACTCAMGRANDSQAVVDSRARVYGVTGLRVVDASAFPILPPGHPMSTIYALAEKIADDIIHNR